ncbi:ABC transporter permease subunit [Skermania sp. ID1734]|uniref:ABC transporter permease n=1 Tax=Skermania sp. ID1734 TaxID=2597516 RepID=UPI00117D7098|nr:ABC transporter permease [Skermania sp. ID1734]TSE00286.1 ABC transporter permease subunit [Skermania sp. ID1734]
MTTAFITQSTLLTARSLRGMRRVPVFLVMTIIQPIMWLLLFGQLFKSVVAIPGFDPHAGDYLEFLTPGVVIMTALFASAWAGTTYVQDSERGVMDRLLTSPVNRGAMMVCTLAYQAVTTIIQTLIIFVIAYAAGARFPGGVGGMLLTIVAATLLSLIFAALSNAVALLTRQQEALIGISQLITLPLMFLSSAVMDTSLSPSWVQTAARYNPVEWAVIASRSALQSDPNWSVVGTRLALLAVVALVMGALSTSAFRVYQRSA